MVESSGGGSCRCACQDDFQDQQTTGCCSPHVFTSVLLGILSCVLMTGGVFLAFHKWDPMWLMVSGVGVVLILIGTVLHCCHNLSQRRPRKPSAVGGKGCCPRPMPPDHPGHVMVNNGSLTEQLLPLSNARSVSQLSLNMLPGYFPPVVTAYGIEQHSAVVQNINRLVQQQQSQGSGSCSPGVASNPGKSFIVLSLPGDASAANIQNLVATVYQLDGNTTTESTTSETTARVSSPVTIIKPNPVPSFLKNAEVQTCNMWPTPTTTAAASCVASTSGDISATERQHSTNESNGQTNIQPHASTTTDPSSGATQTDATPQISNVNLIDCSSDSASICDTPPANNCDNQTTPDNYHNIGALVNIPAPSSSSSSSTDIRDMPVVTSTSSAANDCCSGTLVDFPESLSDGITAPTSGLLVDVSVGSSVNREVLVDITVSSNGGGDSNCNNNNSQHPILEDLMNTAVSVQQADAVAMNSNNARLSNEITLLELAPDAPDPIMGGGLNSELLLSSGGSNLSVDEIDDDELLARSSPPPTYDDVTLEGEAVGAFGLAYGTI